MIRPEDDAARRKARGAFFTPPAIADYLAGWAVGDDPAAKVLDPTCGEAVFLLAAGRRLKALGRGTGDLDGQLFGVDVHRRSLDAAMHVLEGEGLDAHLIQGDFFEVATPDQLGSPLPPVDAIIGNPPFVRYQRHVGSARAKSRQAALRQQVRLSGLASSWAALLVHACGFLTPAGRLAMVLPAELLTVNYAEPVRRWLHGRFEQVHLVLFDRLQFEDAIEKVVLVLAAGHGGCDAFSLYYLDDAKDLTRLRPMTNLAAPVSGSGKWTDLLMPPRARRLFRRTVAEHFVPLATYGAPELGTVTGSNAFFTLTESMRVQLGLSEDAGQVRRVCPPGTKHLTGLTFSPDRWEALRRAGERVWLLCPDPADHSAALRRYVAVGEAKGVHHAYKCGARSPWWRPPVVAPPDLFFTYMSHRYPRLVANIAGVTLVNSMHGVRLAGGVPGSAKDALPLLALNSVTMLGAEIYGQSYGGGILKMEPREAAVLPLPDTEALERAWTVLAPHNDRLDAELGRGRWSEVVTHVDQTLLVQVLGLSHEDVAQLREAASTLRARRTGKSEEWP